MVLLQLPGDNLAISRSPVVTRVYIPFTLQSFGELIAQRFDLLLSAMEIHLVCFDLRFQVLDLDRPGL
jgi:hypothetical protein